VDPPFRVERLTRLMLELQTHQLIIIYHHHMSATQEVTNHYNKLKNEYTEIFKRYIELEEERRENNLVLANLEPLKGERKCWKVVGGVLVEHNLEETKISLKSTINMLESTLKALDDEMAKRQKEVLEMELKYGLNPKKQDSQ
jgi:prefoldin subunit 2